MNILSLCLIPTFLLHSMNWNHSYYLNLEQFGSIGIGVSAIQLVLKILKAIGKQ